MWGVNDADEACELPYTNDLVRLATSALLAIEARHFALPVSEACEAILEGYAASRENGGRPVVLAERRRWLRRLALSDLRDPVAFWARFDSLPSVASDVPRKALQSMLPAPKLPYRVMRRVAGVGSLGRPRFVALALWGGLHLGSHRALRWAAYVGLAGVLLYLVYGLMGGLLALLAASVCFWLAARSTPAEEAPG